MQVSVETVSDLKRNMTVVIPQEEVDAAISKRFDQVKRTARIDGFRPGKIPMSVIKQKFGASVKAEALSELTQNFFYKALMEEKINPASQPVITPNDEKEGDFEFTASFEVYPEVSLKAVEELKLKKPVSSVEKGDIDKMIEKLREQKATWKDAKSKAKKVKDGNQVIIDFEGKVNDTPISEEKITDFSVVIGSKSMIPGFEDALVDAKAGDQLSFDVTFPEDYQQKDFAGQVGHFEVDVKTIQSRELPEIDETFIKEFGVESGTEEDFKADLKKNMSMELDRALSGKRKEIVMDAIVEHNELSVPEALVDSEVEQMIAQLKQNTQQTQQSEPDLPKELFEERATKRVKLGLLLSELIKQNDLQVDESQVQQRIEDFAQTYQSPAEVIDWYNNNPQERQKLESVVLEDQIVDWVLERAKVTETKLTFEELMGPR